MEKAKIILREKTEILDELARKIPKLDETAKKVDVNPGLILSAILFLLAIITLLMNGFSIVVTSISVIYPGLLSIRAIETPDKADDKHWLTYWMVFGFLNVSETFLFFIFYYIPYWNLLRLGFFIWLIKFDGAKYVYK